MAPLIQGLRASPGHVFWPDDISLLDVDHIDASRLLTSGQITDSYLLALAIKESGDCSVRNRLRAISFALLLGAFISWRFIAFHPTPAAVMAADLRSIGLTRRQYVIINRQCGTHRPLTLQVIRHLASYIKIIGLAIKESGDCSVRNRLRAISFALLLGAFISWRFIAFHPT